MSFRDLRDARVSRRRELRSYATSQNVIQSNSSEALDPLPNREPFIVTPAPSSDVLNKRVSMDAEVPAGQSTQSSSPPENLYTELPDFVSIKSSKERGRGLWTKQVIRAGTVIFSTKPYVSVLSSKQLDSHCTACASPRSETGTLKVCTKCRIVRYCDPSCQLADWPYHKAECEAMIRWAKVTPDGEQRQESVEPKGERSADNQNSYGSSPIPNEAIRCLGRIICRRKREGSNKWRIEIDAMQSHRSSLGSSMIDSHVQIAHAIVRYLGIDGPQEFAKYCIQGIEDFVDLISKFSTNSFTLADPLLTPLGVCVSPVAALINHSCDPNVAVVFPRPKLSTLLGHLKAEKGPTEPVLQVVAIQDISAEEELLTSYVDITLPASIRQKTLKEIYNFSCTCWACSVLKTSYSDTQKVDWREAIWCPKACGGVCRLPATEDEIVYCIECAAPVTESDNILDSVRVSQEALDKASILQSSDPDRAIQLLDNAIPLLSRAGLVPGAHPLLALARSRQSLLLERLPVMLGRTEQDKNRAQTFLDSAIRAAAAVTFGLKNILRQGHPIRAIALAELGKLLAVDEPSHDPLKAPSTRSTPSSYEQAIQDASFPPSGPTRLKLAVQTLREAIAELCIAFGFVNEGGETGANICVTLLNLEKELSVWNKGVREALDDAMEEQKGRIAKKVSH